jgi:hypothetical protein
LRVDSTSVAGNIEAYGNTGDQYFMDNMIGAICKLTIRWAMCGLKAIPSKVTWNVRTMILHRISAAIPSMAIMKANATLWIKRMKADDMNDDEMAYMGDDFTNAPKNWVL